MRSQATLAIIAAAGLLLPGLAVAQSGPTPDYATATRFDVSPPLREIVLPPAAQTGASVEINPIEAPDRVPPAGAAGEAGPAPNRQTEAWLPSALAPTPAPDVNFEGLTDDQNALVVGGRVAPPDTEGDIGPNHYVQWVNLIWAIWDVSRDPVTGRPTGATMQAGFPKAGSSIFAGFGGVCESNNNGDPIVLYDHLADRWMLSQFAVNFGVQCVAVSQTPDPGGPYYRYELPVSPGEQNDYPKFGLMPDSYYLSLRDFPSTPDLASAVAIDRIALLTGDPGVRLVKFSLPCQSNNCPDGIQPPHLEGPPPPAGTPGIFTKVWDDNFDGPLTGTDGVRLWKLTVDWSNPSATPPASFTELNIVATPNFNNDMCGFFNRNCVPQASATQRLDAVDELQMYRAQYRHWAGHDSLLVSTTVDATGTDVAGVLWAEIRNTNPTGSDTWTLFQQGTYAPADGENRWMSSIAMNGDGEIALGYSVSSSVTDPAIRYNTRTAADALGTLPGGEVEMQMGLGAQLQTNRWGDYSAMSVDPVNECTFWYTQEYYPNTAGFDWNTKIGAFTLTGCNTDRCGNGHCQAGESCTTCAADCELEGNGGGGDPGVCGNGVCEPAFGEDCLSCAADCRGKQNGNPAGRFCCGDGDGENPIVCSDGDGTVCNQSGFQCGTVGGGTPTILCCGDGMCDVAGGECGLCGLDCDADPACTGGGGGCVPTASKEKGPRCSNGLDDDCDGLIDAADPDC